MSVFKTYARRQFVSVINATRIRTSTATIILSNRSTIPVSTRSLRTAKGWPATDSLHRYFSLDSSSRARRPRSRESRPFRSATTDRSRRDAIRRRPGARYHHAEMAKGRDRRMSRAGRRVAISMLRLIAATGDGLRRYDRSPPHPCCAAPVLDRATYKPAISRRARRCFRPDTLPRNAACRSVPRTRCISWDR